MITREYRVPGFEAPVTVHRNEDWSGIVVIEWTDVVNQQHHRTQIPAQLLMWVSFKETKAWMLEEVGRALARLQGGSL
jgi:hypothetical protein